MLADGSLYLAFGSFLPEGAGAHAIALEICKCLSEAGFAVTTPIDAETRILITGLDWRKRSPR